MAADYPVSRAGSVRMSLLPVMLATTLEDAASFEFHRPGKFEFPGRYFSKNTRRDRQLNSTRVLWFPHWDSKAASRSNPGR
jgi:hypothetical protein